MSSNTQKLRVLRERTDHDLLILVQHEIDRGFALVDVATTRNSAIYAGAEKGFTTAKALLPRICGFSQDDRLRMEARLNELRMRLDQVPAFSKVPCYPASYAS